MACSLLRTFVRGSSRFRGYFRIIKAPHKFYLLVTEYLLNIKRESFINQVT